MMHSPKINDQSRSKMPHYNLYFSHHKQTAMQGLNYFQTGLLIKYLS